MIANQNGPCIAGALTSLPASSATGVSDLAARKKRLDAMPPNTIDHELGVNRGPILPGMIQSSFEDPDKASAIAEV